MNERPKFVRVGFWGSALRRMGNTTRYYRHAGDWSVESTIVNGEIVALSTVHALNGRLLTECTEQEWREDNGGYVDPPRRVDWGDNRTETENE